MGIIYAELKESNYRCEAILRVDLLLKIPLEQPCYSLNASLDASYKKLKTFVFSRHVIW